LIGGIWRNYLKGGEKASTIFYKIIAIIIVHSLGITKHVYKECMFM
jgi:hypothetical protein